MRTQSLVGRLSEAGYALASVYAHRDYASLLVAKLDVDLDSLSAYLSLTHDGNDALRLFRHPVRLARRALREGERESFVEDGDHLVSSNIVGVLATVGGFEALFTPGDFRNLEGEPDALSSDLCAVIEMITDDHEALAETVTNSIVPPAGRPGLVVVNDTPRSRQFIASARAVDPGRKIRLVTGERHNRWLHNNLVLEQANSPSEAAQLVLIDGEAAVPSGTRVFVFLREGENYDSEDWTLQFLHALDQLQTRMRQSDVGFETPSHQDLYVVVESRVHSEHGYEFLHNQLHVDSVFDPTMGERSMFAAIAQMIAQYGLPESPQAATEALRRYTELAGGLGNLELRSVTDPLLVPGPEVMQLAGLSLEDVSAIVARLSITPSRLLSVLRFKPFGQAVSLEPVADGPEDFSNVKLNEGDLLVILNAL